MLRKSIIVLAACFALAGQAWAGSPNETPAAPASGKKVPIIDVVAKAPVPADLSRILPTAASPDLRLNPSLAQALNLNRKADDGKGQSGLSLQAGSLDSQYQSFRESARDRRLDGLQSSGDGGHTSYLQDMRLDENDQQGGFLALRWKATASSEITVGGGYTKLYNSTSSTVQGTASAVRGGSSALSSRSDTTSVGGGDPNGRWGAFLAVPYQLGRNVGVRPEVSYYHGELPDAGRDSTNEWVMGLRFTFGF